MSLILASKRSLCLVQRINLLLRLLAVHSFSPTFAFALARVTVGSFLSAASCVLHSITQRSIDFVDVSNNQQDFTTGSGV